MVVGCGALAEDLEELEGDDDDDVALGKLRSNPFPEATVGMGPPGV
jgi:hypothetical protein